MLEWKVVEDWLVRLGGSALDLLVKIALALVAYFVVKKILKRFCRWLSGQMERKNVDVSVRSFVLSIIRYGVMIFTVVTIVVNLDLIQASSIAAVIASAGGLVFHWRCRAAFKFCGRRNHFAFKTVSGRRLHHCAGSTGGGDGQKNRNVLYHR